MLALLAAFLISLSGARAQSNTEYSFRQQSVADGQAYNSNGDPVPVLSMDCLAANGYGQWTMSTQPGQGNSGAMGSGATLYPAGWYLLANGLYASSTGFVSGDPSHPQCIPPGTVQNGTLASTSNQPRVVSNLDGTTVYIWPDPTTRNSFVVQEFSPANINIAIAPGFPNATGSRQVITSGPVSLPTGTVSTLYSGVNHTVVNDEADYRDECDFAIDGGYLYVTWCWHDPHAAPTQRTVFVEAYNLNTWALAPNYPIMVGQGWRPRLSCDPRGNRNGGTTPQFDLAYILSSTAPPDGFPVWLTYSGAVSTAHSITNNFIYAVDGSMLPYAACSHICPLVSSVYPGPMNGMEHHALYATVGQYLGLAINELILYNEDDPNLTPAGTAAYVDGSLLPWANPDGLILGGYGIIDHWIEAFANPYDNGDNFSDPIPNWREFDQFHCLYQVNETVNGVARAPLVIVRGADNGSNFPVPFQRDANNNPVDTRLVLNQVEMTPPPPQPTLLPDDPSSYVAAINQMGIHVHWRTSTNIHFYARDMGETTAPDHHISRAFDEPIDENTLVTDECTVSDGTAHGGSVGSSIKGYNLMTVWTDPNYGPSAWDGTSGLFSPRVLGLHNEHVGQVQFVGNNVKLTVGGAVNEPCNGGLTLPPCSATLTVMPFFYFDFLGSGQSVMVNPTSTFEYYGLYATHDNGGDLPPLAIGTPFTDGTGDGTGAGTIDLEGDPTNDPSGLPAILNVHGGADFYTGAGGKLVSNYGQINVVDEAALYPEWDPAYFTTNSPTTGHLTLRGQTTLNYSTYSVNIPDGTSAVTMSIENGYIGNDPNYNDGWQFKETHCNFFNTPTTAASEIDLGTLAPGASSFSSVIFQGGTASATRLTILNPGSSSPVEIDSMTFSNEGAISNEATHYWAIMAEYDGDPTTNSSPSIMIDNNEFAATNYDANLSTAWFSDISISGFDNPSDQYPAVHIVDNKFDRENWGLFTSCITLNNTTATIVGNSLDGAGRSYGININGSYYGTNPYPPNSYSMICNNAFSESYRFSPLFSGIYSTYYHGSIKLNNFVPTDIPNIGTLRVDFGYVSSDGDNPLVVFNYMEYGYVGIWVQGSSTVDMTGLHSASYDYAAFNTIKGPSFEELLSCGALNTGAPIVLGTSSSYVAMGAPAGTQWSSDYGYNNVVVTNPAGGTWYSKITAGTQVNIGSLDQNYWANDYGGGNIQVDDPWYGGGACSPSCVWMSHTPGPTDAYQIDYTATSGKSWGSAQSYNFDVACGVGYPGDVASKGKSKPTAAASSPATYCDTLFAAGFYQYGPNQQWQQCYDTLKKFIETCANYPLSYRAFNELGAAAQGLNDPSDAIMFKFEDWLESVLYLNTTDPEYFCACAELLGTPHPEDTTPALIQLETNRRLALVRWLLQNTTCDTAMLRKQYDGARQTQITTHRLDSTYGNNYPLDTTLPSMADLGLDTLLNRHLLYAEVTGRPGIISNAAASPNPVSSGTIISFGISKEAYVKIEVFDILGNRVSSAGFESLFEPGNKAVPVSLQGLPAGTYFARIVTAYGEVQTVKLVKE